MSVKQQLAKYVNLSLSPGLSDTELDELEKSFSLTIPSEFLELLRYASGFDDPELGKVDFTGRYHRFEFKELSPHGIPLIHTKQGNFWVLDASPCSEAWRYVFYFSHDPPVMIVQFDSLESFMDSAVSGGEMIESAARLASSIWDDRSHGMPVHEARESSDVQVARFALELPDNFCLFDLRNNSVGRGFAWGRGGSCQQCIRSNTELIFAIETGKSERGLLSKLLGS